MYVCVCTYIHTHSFKEIIGTTKAEKNNFYISSLVRVQLKIKTSFTLHNGSFLMQFIINT